MTLYTYDNLPFNSVKQVFPIFTWVGVNNEASVMLVTCPGSLGQISAVEREHWPALLTLSCPATLAADDSKVVGKTTLKATQIE